MLKASAMYTPQFHTWHLQRRSRTRSWYRWLGLPAAAAIIAAVVPATSAAAADTCISLNGAWQITASCTDPNYTNPVITGESDATSPVPYHEISGKFGNSAFNIYLPPPAQWKGRFFQQTYPLQSADAPSDVVSFGSASGGYTVNVAGSGGYRLEAAVAKFAKTVAASYYHYSGRIYGYLYGASGGSYPTIGAMENTTGVWDGAVPIVMGTPTSIPNNFFIREYARFVLQDKAQQIAGAVRPGGSGDPYLGLTSVQASVLQEVTRLGVPLSGWEDPTYLLGLDQPGGLLGFAGTVRALDPNYAQDFWSKPGYLGTEQSALGNLFRASRVVTDATITKVTKAAGGTVSSLALSGVPAAAAGVQFDVTIASGQGSHMPVAGMLDGTTGVFTPGAIDSATAALLQPGATLHVDDSWYLALLVYHRYQTPTALDFHAWDQFRNPDGSPIYPVRAINIGAAVAGSVSGNAAYSGKVKGKVILVDDLNDVDAYPWDASWYSERAKQALGASYDATVRLWYFQSADHVGADPSRNVSYNGFVQQALRDLSAWVEGGVAPAASTKYAVTQDSQISVGDSPTRGGIQPTVDLSVAGGDRVDVRVGQPVHFQVKAQVPHGMGAITKIEWDFAGTGDFAATPAPIRPFVVTGATHRFASPGTYIVGVRVTEQREADPATPFGLVQNIDRVRVVVHR